MYTLSQEVEVWYIIPALRRELSKGLIKNHKTTYEKTGKLLGITKAAVSQYLGNKRASRIKLHPKVLVEIEKSTERIVNRRANTLREIQRLLKFIQKKGLHCEVCGRIVDGELHDCKQVVPMYEEL